MYAQKMKGTKVLLHGESFNERKDSHWSMIHTCQDLIAVIQKCCPASPLKREVIASNREIIKQEYAELKELQRWYKQQTDLDPDEPYKSPRYKAWEASLTEEQWEERINKAHILDQLRERYEGISG